MKITQKRRIEAHDIEQHLRDRCDLCGAESDYPGKWREANPGHDSIASDMFYLEGCAISRKQTSAPPGDYYGTARSADLCPGCVTRVLDWIEQQGGTTRTEDFG